MNQEIPKISQHFCYAQKTHTHCVTALFSSGKQQFFASEMFNEYIPLYRMSPPPRQKNKKIFLWK